jgi:putative ABC transport system permease protein
MLLRLITLPYVRRHLLRTTLTVAGIVLGVAVFVGMHTANEAVLHAFQRTVDRIAGATQLQVTAGDTGFDEEVLERVQAVPGVRVAVPVIEALAASGISGEGNLLILGVDMTGDRSLREYDLESGEEALIDDPLVFLAQPDSIMITSQFAARNNLAIGSRISMETMDGEKRFTVRGILRTGGLTSAFGGNLAIMDVYAVQKTFGRGQAFDRIDIAVADGVAVAGVRKRLQSLLGPGFQVDPPSSRRETFEAMSRAFSISVSFSSFFALLIGMFIIYNSFAIAVTQRRSEIGILRALGATRRQIRDLYLVEGAIAGILGSTVGAIAGIGLARAMAGFITNLMGQVYGIAQKPEELSTDLRVVAIAVGIGILTSVIAAFVPARNAARVDPVQALQKGKYQVLGAGENRRRIVAAAALLVLSLACLPFGDRALFFYLAYLFTVMAALLLTPAVALRLARLLRPALRRIRPVEGALAADSLIQSPRRTSATVAALMLSLALAVGFAGVTRASYGSIVDWMDTALNPDLFIATSETLSNQSFRFPAAMAGELYTISGIETVQPVRNPRVMFRGTPVMLVASDIRSISAKVNREAVEGDPRDMYRRTAQGQSVVISDNLALRENIHLGDMIELASPRGLVRLPVAGVTIDYSDQQGSILIDRSVYVHYWGDDTVNLFRVYLDKGVSVEEVKRRILARFADQRKLFVFTNRDLRGYVLRVTDQWFGLTYVQLAVAVLVAILGIVNTLTVSITDRRRELGVLQAVGALRRQIRHTIWMEAVSIGLLGLILGVALGAVSLYYDLWMIRQHVAGLRLQYEFPVEFSAMLLPVIVGAALLSALGPAESAVRGSLVEALEYE